MSGDDRNSRVPALILGASDLSAAPVAGLIALGAIVAIAGHVVRSRKTVVAGIAILFVATLLLIAGAYVAYRSGGADPRPCDAPGGC
jgi:hypothetical protein